MEGREYFAETKERFHTSELEKRLESVASRAEAVDIGVMWALEQLDVRYGARGTIRPLEYHNRAHSEQGVTNAALDVYRAIVGEEKDEIQDKELIRIAGAFHDLVQFFDHDKRDTTGVAEEASAEAAREYMEAANHAYERTHPGGSELFSQDDISQVEEAIRATIATFEPEKGFLQPNLYRTKSNVARAIALADLNAAGLRGADVFVSEGNALFREENRKLVEALSKGEVLEPAEREQFRDAIMRWRAIQAEFATRRKENFEIEIADPTLEPDARDRLRTLFSRFDESIESANLRIHSVTVNGVGIPIEDASLEDLAHDMGIEVGSQAAQ
jgi:hypothetical protein